MIARARAEPRPERDDRLGGDVREREVGRRQVVLAQISLLDFDRDAVVGGVPLGRLDGLGIEVECPHGREAELRGRDREDAGAAADVEHASPLLALEQLQAELRRRMAAGAERAARVDHDRERVGVGLLPGWADPERADANRLVELAPAVLPVLFDVRRGGAAEGLPDPLLAGRVRVRRQLEGAAVAAELLEAFGKSSSMTARASSARASGTVIETRRRSVSGSRF